jgi:hypothetical protein
MVDERIIQSDMDLILLHVKIVARFWHENLPENHMIDDGYVLQQEVGEQAEKKI